MANTVNNTIPNDRLGVEISAMDEDYNYGSDLRVQSIKFYPGAADDELVVFDKSTSGVEMCRLVSSDGEPRIEYFHGNIWHPYIDYSACTLSSNHKVVIVRDRTLIG